MSRRPAGLQVKGNSASGESTPALQNRHIVLIALLLTGGAAQFIDIEDIAVLAHQLSPTRFRWNRYDYPSLEAARVGFKRWSDLKIDPPLFLTRRLSYALTPAGIQEAVRCARIMFGRDFSSPQSVIEHVSAIGKDVSEALPATQQRPSQNELRELRRHNLFERWRRGEIAFERWEVADLLNCMPDSSDQVWRERFRHYESLASFWQDEEISNFLDAVKSCTVRI